MGRNHAFEYLADGPFCLAALDSSSGQTVQVNRMFETHLGPLYKYKALELATFIADPAHKTKFLAGVERVVSGISSREYLSNVEMITLAGEAGLPINRHFDWTIGKGAADDDSILLFGYPCSEQTLEQRANDSELVDYFQNAPIALHWLSGEGIVLWANQTELNVLGYTAEEYIGQPIMKFCPDEKELVLEIFQQLGSGNAIKDVPVRFRTKDGRHVNLLIDSNVKYSKDGSFGHTRCFIRDDTKRKIREEQAKLLLSETKRSLKMLDNFMRRAIHHMRTPLQIMQHTCELVAETLATEKGANNGDKVAIDHSLQLINNTSETIRRASNLADDIILLGRLDQGACMDLKNDNIDLVALGKDALSMMRGTAPGVLVSLHLGAGVPDIIVGDRNVLLKIIRQLLDNAANATKQGTISLIIEKDNDDLWNFTVFDTGPGVAESATETVPGHLPLIFQRYHHELLPEDLLDFEEADTIRSKIEKQVNAQTEDTIGIGLSLCYFLSQALGGELRYSSQPGSTKFWFSIPSAAANTPSDSPEQYVPNSLARQFFFEEKGTSSSTEAKNIVERVKPTPIKSVYNTVEDEPELMKAEVPKSNIASFGLNAMDSPSILVVEDTKMCAKLLCMTLRKLNCSTTVAENGQEAIDILHSSDPGMYNLILMDLRMPVMDGIAATKIIKEELKLATPVIAITAETGEEIKQECETVGFDGFRNKPIKRDHLREIIETYIVGPL